MFMRHFDGMVFECGAQIIVKPMRNVKWAKLGRNSKRNKSDWIECTWAGLDNRTREHMIVAPRGGPALKVRTIRATPASER